MILNMELLNEMDDQQKHQTIKDYLIKTGSIFINLKLANIIGLNAALLYSALVSKYYYYKEKDKLNDHNFFFCTINDMQKSTTLTKKQQGPAIQILVRLGLIDMHNYGFHRQRYFRVNENFKPLLDVLKSPQETINVTLGNIESDKKDPLNVPKGDINKNTLIINEKKIKILLMKSKYKNRIYELILFYLNKYENLIKVPHPILEEEKWEQVIKHFEGYLNALSEKEDDVGGKMFCYIEENDNPNKTIVKFVEDEIKVSKDTNNIYFINTDDNLANSPIGINSGI